MASITSIGKRVIKFVFANIYTKPKSLIRLILNPSSIRGTNYYPEKEEKSSFRIFWDQVLNILRHSDIDKFYYLYGLNVRNFRKTTDYLHYIPFMSRRNELNLSSKHNSSCILRDKLFFGVFAKAFGIDTPENVAHIRNNDVLLLSEGLHSTIDEFISNYNGTFFCKPLDGECGNGVFKLNIKDKHIEINGVEANIKIFSSLITGRDYIIQRCIEQHPSMKSLHPSSINSLRLVTVRSLRDSQIYVMPSVLRIGTNGSIVDNTSQGGIAIGFDLKTGRLNEYGLQKPEFGLRIDTHPNSSIKFSSFQIPYIEEAIKKAKYFHSFLDLHSIGWDIAIGESGPIFVEGNDNWEINGPQSCNHGLVSEFKEYFYK